MAKPQIQTESQQPPTLPPPPVSQNPDYSYPAPNLLLKLMSKRRTWVCLFVSVYTLLLSLSWNLLKSALEFETSYSSSPSSSGRWPALYASLLLGAAFGVLSAAAALAVAVPATVVTWITVLVLLTFCGRPRKVLVVEGRKLTAEISGSVARVLIREGNVVAAVCAVVGYFALVGKHTEEGMEHERR